MRISRKLLPENVNQSEVNYGRADEKMLDKLQSIDNAVRGVSTVRYVLATTSNITIAAPKTICSDLLMDT